MQQAPAAQKTPWRASKSATLWTLVKQNLVSPGLDLIFPPVCIGCGRVDALLCDNCIASIKPPEYPDQKISSLTDIIALGVYDGVLQKAVHALKYDHHTALAQPLGQLLAEKIRASGWPPSLVMPVPLHPDRRKKRGYNQAGLIARAIAYHLNWRYSDNLLHRVRATSSQVGLDFRARQENVNNAFCIDDFALVQTSNVILVDDVYTTGATMRECATTLKNSGELYVRACVVGQTKLS